jgi:hypothetical protein
MSRVTGRFRSHRVTTPHGLNGVDALRERLEAANCHVADSERLVAGWRDIIERKRAAGHDVSVARDLLETFQTGLEVAMAEKEQAEKTLARGCAISLRESKAVCRRMIRSYKSGSPRPKAKPRRRLNRPRFRHGARETGHNGRRATAHQSSTTMVIRTREEIGHVKSRTIPPTCDRGRATGQARARSRRERRFAGDRPTMARAGRTSRTSRA